jgi:hypothetical protein
MPRTSFESFERESEEGEVNFERFIKKQLKELAALAVVLQDANCTDLPKHVEQVFRTIDAAPNQPDPSKQLKNCRVDVKRLKKYLQQRYSFRIAQRLVQLFEIPQVPVDFYLFYKILFTAVFPLDQPVDELLKRAREKAFLVFDMNADGFIDQSDLFSFMQDVRNEETLAKAAYTDI